MKRLVTIFACLSLGTYLLLAIFSTSVNQVSFLVGAFISLINLYVTGLVCRGAIYKKSVALVISAIVFKYPILGASAFIALKIFGLSGAWIAAGVSTIVPTVLVYGFWELFETKKLRANIGTL